MHSCARSSAKWHCDCAQQPGEIMEIMQQSSLSDTSGEDKMFTVSLSSGWVVCPVFGDTIKFSFSVRSKIVKKF